MRYNHLSTACLFYIHRGQFICGLNERKNYFIVFKNTFYRQKVRKCCGFSISFSKEEKTCIKRLNINKTIKIKTIKCKQNTIYDRVRSLECY